MSRYGRSRRHGDEEEEGADADLNLTPYLDIMMNLVIFLIFSFQVIIEFRLIDVVPPALSSSASAGASNETPKPQPTLLITRAGYRLVSSQPDLMPAVDIPKKGEKYDTAELKDRLISWKKEFGLAESIVFTADLDTEYKIVVEAMDAIRMDGKEWLFPDVLLARPSGVK